MAIDPGACKAALEDGTMLQALLAAVSEQQPDADLNLVERAYAIASEAHAGQVRRSGEPYLMHPMRVAHTIAMLGLDTHAVAAGLLHDAIEDSSISVYDLTESFGREVARIVDGVTKLGSIPYLSSQERQAESFRKMLLAMARDIRVLLVKLTDRLDNMRTLDHVPSAKRERISRETMEIYAPLANRLGIEWLRRQLQDLSFRYLEPAAFEEINARMEALLDDSPGFVEDGVLRLMNVFSNLASSAAVLGEDGWASDAFGPVEVRATLRSAYKVKTMMERQERKLEAISDLVTYQIITRDRAACYAALGVLHAHFSPIPGGFRDYIALPRPNQYRALHTAVVDRDGVRMELQIRSVKMDAIAERGIVASRPGDTHWEVHKLAWIGQLMDWQEEVLDPNEFIAAVKAELFADEVYVFTPHGDIHTFPKGATPIDFAFAIHSDIGMHCSGARVNGQAVPLRYQLRQGDKVEILTNPNYGPRPDWVGMCITSRAQARVKHYLRQQERERLREIGRSLVEQELAARGLDLEEIEETGMIADQCERLGLSRTAHGEDGVYEAVGDGQVTVGALVELIVPGGRGTRGGGQPNVFARMLQRMAGRGLRRPEDGRLPLGQGHAGRPIEITRERLGRKAGADAMIRLAPCCSPIPGDPIVAFFRAGGTITTHREGCPEALKQLSDRRVHLAWAEGLELDCPVTLEVRSANRVGLLAEMSRAFSGVGVNIKQANCRSFDDGKRAVNTFSVTIRKREQLETLVMALEDIKGVTGIERVFAHEAQETP
jgi:GTP pyrophosphokinase